MDYYEFLEVSRNASREVIDKAYKTLATKYHPDVVDVSQREQAEEYMIQLNHVHSVLMDEELKAQYDSQLYHEESAKNIPIEEEKPVMKYIEKLPNWLRWALSFPLAYGAYAGCRVLFYISANLYLGLNSEYVNAIYDCTIATMVLIITFNSVIPSYKNIVTKIFSFALCVYFYSITSSAIYYENYVLGSFEFTFLSCALIIITTIATNVMLKKSTKRY